jgi:hypothetical protein
MKSRLHEYYKMRINGIKIPERKSGNFNAENKDNMKRKFFSILSYASVLLIIISGLLISKMIDLNHNIEGKKALRNVTILGDVYIWKYKALYKIKDIKELL